MKRLNAVSLAAGASTLALGLVIAPKASASGPNDFGCYDQSVRCSSWGFSGTCAYNVSQNGCTCGGEYPYGAGTWERGSGDCQS
jgi:hypothetical protein